MAYIPPPTTMNIRTPPHGCDIQWQPTNNNYESKSWWQEWCHWYQSQPQDRM